MVLLKQEMLRYNKLTWEIQGLLQILQYPQALYFKPHNKVQGIQPIYHHFLKIIFFQNLQWRKKENTFNFIKNVRNLTPTKFLSFQLY